MKKLLVLAGILSLGPMTALAADSGVYFDVSLGQAFAKDIGSKDDFDDVTNTYVGSVDSSTLDDTASSWSAVIGYKFLPYVAVDAGYVDFGTDKYRAILDNSSYLYKNQISARGATLAAMGILPLGKRFELTARAGVLFSKTTLDVYLSDGLNNTSAALSTSSKDLFFGAGGAFKFTDRFSVRLGWQRFNDVGDKYETGESDIDVVSLGVTFSQ